MVLIKIANAIYSFDGRIVVARVDDKTSTVKYHERGEVRANWHRVYTGSHKKCDRLIGLIWNQMDGRRIRGESIQQVNIDVLIGYLDESEVEDE